MNPDDTLPPVPPASAASDGTGDVWPSSGPAKGFRVRLPIAIASLVVVALAGAAAGASLKHTSSTSTTQAGAVTNRPRGTFGGTNGAGGANGAGRFGPGGGGVLGTVTKVEGNTITLTQRDGTTATVVVPSGATISKTVSGSLSDLKAGTQIAVRGTTANGKTTADTVAIANGTGGFGGFGGGFGGRQNGAGTGSGTGSGTTTTN
jgi:hypothetical protein